MANDRYWYHGSGFDEDSLVEFERRLGRARVSSRPGYLRVKGATLLKLEDPAATDVAIRFLNRVVTDYDDFIEVPWSHELLGRAHLRAGRLDLAEFHLRRCIETADERRNGTSGATELMLAELLLDQDRIGEAGEMLTAQDQQRSLMWNAQIFRYVVARARWEDRSGGSPGPWAKQALKLASIEEPQLPRMPDLGVVKPDRATLREMKRLAKQ